MTVDRDSGICVGMPRHMPVSAPDGSIMRSDSIQREHWVLGQVKVVLLKRQPRDAGLPSEGDDLLSGFFRSRGCRN